MPRRPASARVQSPPPLGPSSPPQASTAGASLPDDPLSVLRRQWKWAAFGQFFFTFNHLFSMSDVALTNIEDDLVNNTRIVLPRVMQRLLWVLSYDRKITLNNWQTALRKQYRKRDPSANPIGPEPRVEITDDHESPPPSLVNHGSRPRINGEGYGEVSGTNAGISEAPEDHRAVPTDPAQSTRGSTLDRDAGANDSKGVSVQPSEIESEPVNVKLGMHSVDIEEGESRDWFELSMLEKLDSMHILSEWQFHNPMRLRTLMRSDDETASWRIEPIGYDAKMNAYWLIGADRLWIQRRLPKPSRPKSNPSLKRKRTSSKPTAKSKSKSKKQNTSNLESECGPHKHPRLHDENKVVTGGKGRAAKIQAKLKLDQQAADLADFKRQQAASQLNSRNGKGIGVTARASGSRATRNSTTVNASPARGSRTTRAAMAAAASARPLRGTRSSARLRGTEADSDGWQTIPEEWLTGGAKDGDYEGSSDEDENEEGGGRATKAVNGKALRTGLESEGSVISDLTELSESSMDAAQVVKGDERDEKNDEEDDEEDFKEEEVEAAEEPAVKEEEPTYAIPEDFVEWETICVTLSEWEHVAERFEKATHYSEHALYKLLVNTLVPAITEELREIERKQQMTLAVTQRKRSSRLLLRQTEREEAEAAARKRAEEAERNSRAKRVEARAKREEDARLAREMRRREREEREERERLEKEKTERAKVDGYEGVIEVGLTRKGTISVPPVTRIGGAAGKKTNGTTSAKSGSRTPVGEEWELDCEICHRRGINIDEGVPMMSCGKCSKWQHIACHDAADQKAGRRRRNWDLVEFICLQCRSKRISATSDFRGAPGVLPAPQPFNPYLNHPMIGTTSYDSNTYLNSFKRQQDHRRLSANASPGVNGGVNSSVYLRDRQTASPGLNMRAPGPPHSYHHSQSPHVSLQSHYQQQQQPAYGAPISFTHYQPQQRDFSTAQQIPFASGNVQSYGQAALMNQYSQQYPIPMVNGSDMRQGLGTSSQDTTPHQVQQANWNMVASGTHRQQAQIPVQHAVPPLQGYNPDAFSPTPSGHHHTTIAPTPSPHTHWQPLDNFNRQQQQGVPQFHFKYQPAPS